MKTFCVVTTVHCNLRCTYCYNQTHENSVVWVRRDLRRPRQFSAELVAECVSALVARRVETLVVSGGEPFLAPVTPLWLEASGAQALSLRIISNVTHLSDHLVRALAGHPSVVVSVSIGGATQQTHDRDRGGWDETMVGLDRLRAAGVPYEFSFVLTHQSFMDLGAVNQLARAHGVRARIAALSPGNDGDLARLSLRGIAGEVWDEAVEECDDPQLSRDLAVVAAYYRGSLEVRHCGMRTRSQVMDPSGNVYGCFFRRDVHFGNVFETPLSQLLAGIDAEQLLPAPCFGEHCLTMLYH